MTIKILRVDGSMRRDGSRSRKLASAIVDRLQELHGQVSLRTRDLAGGLPFIDASWIDANFTAPSERTANQRSILACSDAVLNELKEADILVIGTPIYNFGVPAAVKAWIDLITRAKEAFRYAPDGPEGLLTGKTAYIVLTSGGTKAGSEIDFAWPYLRHILGFVGISDVHLIASDLKGIDAESADAAALQEISTIDGRTSTQDSESSRLLKEKQAISV